jgi:hypothetical protein
MTYDPRKVVSYGFPLDDFIFTYNISGAVAQTDLGKAVTLDATADSSMKLAGDGDPIDGRLLTYEDRSQQGAGKTGAVARRFKELLPIKAGLAGFNVVARGDTVVGAGNGEVRASNNGAAKTPDHKVNIVVALVTVSGSNFAVVESL